MSGNKITVPPRSCCLIATEHSDDEYHSFFGLRETQSYIEHFDVKTFGSVPFVCVVDFFQDKQRSRMNTKTVIPFHELYRVNVVSRTADKGLSIWFGLLRFVSNSKYIVAKVHCFRASDENFAPLAKRANTKVFTSFEDYRKKEYLSSPLNCIRANMLNKEHNKSILSQFKKERGEREEVDKMKETQTEDLKHCIGNELFVNIFRS